MAEVKKIEGSAGPALAVALVAIVVLIVVITVYNRVLHTAEEASAYRYAEKRNEANQLKAICDENAKTSDALKIWIQQQNFKTKPPPELLVLRVCAVKEKENN